jgi:diguanylate cyclase (GGDEF)-like protein/PAS domain S-box-containing protein
MGYAVLPVAMWAGTRLPTRTAALHALFAAVAATAGTLADAGPFADARGAQQTLLLHGFVVVVVLITVLLALDRDERSVLALDLAARSTELERSEQHYRLVAEHAGDAIGRIAADGSVLWTSPSTGRVFGLGTEHVQGAARAEVVHPEDLPAVAAATDSVFSGGEPAATVRFRVPQADGTVRWMESHLSPVRDAGRVVEVVTLARDVTAQVRLQAQLADGRREAELARAQLVEALDASPDGFMICRLERDAGGRVGRAVLETVNAACSRAVGRAAAELVGLDLRAVLPDAEVLGLWAAVQAAGDGTPQRLTMDLLHTRLAAVLDSSQVLLPGDRLLCSWRDVTEQTRREQLLAEAYEDTARVRVVLQTAIDAMVDAFLVHQVERDLERPGPDGLGEVVAAPALLANVAAADRLGVPADDLVGADLRALVPEAAPYGLWDRLVEAVSTGRPQSVRIHHEDEDGAWARSEDLTLALCADDQVVVLFRDASADERQLRDISQDRESAVHAAHHDPLTGMPNRTALRLALDAALDDCRPGELVAVVFVDLDGFKAVNDTWGHAAGDTVLQTAAQRLTGLVRAHDTAARLSGDEFVLVMRHIPKDWSSGRFFDRARTVLSDPVPVLAPATDGGGPGLVTVRPGASFGLVLADPHDPAGSPRADELLALADARMYEQKRDRKAVSAGATTVR